MTFQNWNGPIKYEKRGAIFCHSNCVCAIFSKGLVSGCCVKWPLWSHFSPFTRVQISKFLWTIKSCAGRDISYVLNIFYGGYFKMSKAGMNTVGLAPFISKFSSWAHFCSFANEAIRTPLGCRQLPASVERLLLPGVLKYGSLVIVFPLFSSGSALCQFYLRLVSVLF